MINEKFTLNEVFKEAKGRVDGSATLIFMLGSVFMPVLVAGLKPVRFGYFEFNWTGLTVPVIIFLTYIRFRQLDADESKLRQIINSVLIGVASFSLVYVFNFR